MSMMIKCIAILFDLDGVLVDSGSTIERLWRRWAARHALDPDAVLGLTPGRRAVETIQLAAPELDCEAEALALEADQVCDLSELRAMPGARGLTAALPPRYWAVVTSGSRFVATTRLNATGIQLPAVMVTADDVSRGKPDPEGYLAAAASLGVDAADCVVVEDARSGVLAARAAGMATVGIDGSPLGPRSDVCFAIRDLRDLQVQRAESGTGLLVSSCHQGGCQPPVRTTM